MRKDQSLATRLVPRLAAGTGAALLAAGLLAEAAIAEPNPIATKINQLGGATLSQLTGKAGDKTVLLSPYGLGSALHLLMAGAQLKSTAENSLKAKLVPDGTRDLNKAREDLRAFNNTVLDVEKSAGKVILKSESAVFVPQSAEVSALFSGRATGVLKATLSPLDFKSPKAVEAINTWVKDKTDNQIPAILEKLEPDARFVLLNAVYFKGAWMQSFDAAKTAQAPFTRVDGSKQDVPMMNASLPVAHAELGPVQAVWLPYAGKDIAMVVIAPRADGGPKTVAETLEAEGNSIDKLIAKAGQDAQMRTVTVRLPRFRAESFLDITDALNTQIAPALTKDADYSPINDTKGGPLMVVHRVVLDVSEAGTVAAAATGITTDRSLAVSPTFSADRPFAFGIVHRPTGAVLFTGYVADPSAK